MALLEINLEKPALVEEYQYPGETSTGTQSTGDTTDSESSGGGKGKLLGLLAVVAGVGLLVWKLKSRGGTEQTEVTEFEEEQEYEHGPEPDIGQDDVGSDESGGVKRKAAGFLGLVVAVVSLVSVARKRRN
ncbi:hypothetical protein [Halorussus salinisoli]|uniref:hypothetical protein n=1 Tax=Halorussus salinisoli TaxID=2558242 RepID=UPI0010C1DC3B|nr:hypothetical protein [Halorussus salinisoli]